MAFLPLFFNVHYLYVCSHCGCTPMQTLEARAFFPLAVLLAYLKPWLIKHGVHGAVNGNGS